MNFYNYALERLSKDTVHIAKELCDKYVGKDLYDETYLYDLTNKENHFFYLLFKEDKAVGYYYCYYDTVTEVLKDEESFNSAEIRALLGADDARIGVCRSIGVDELERGKKLSDKLLKHFEIVLFEHCCSVILVPCWKKDEFVPAKGHLERSGYTYACTLITPWINNTKLKCPYCKKGKCICDAALFYKRAS